MDLSTPKSAENDIDDCPPTPENLPTGEAAKTPPPSTALLSPNKPSLSEARKKRRSSDGRTSPEETTCAICLGQLDNRSYTDTCFHKFCFTCLLEWSKVKAECPLCKGKFTSIIHNIRSDEDYDTYEVPQREPQPEIVYHDFLHSMRRFRYHTTQTADRLNRRRQDLAAQVAALNDNMVLPSVPYNLSSRQIYRRRRGPGTTEFRRDIYTRNLWVQPLSDFTGRFRECSGEWYEQNEATTHRLVPWLNRELNVLLEGTRYQAQNPMVMNLITEWIKRYDIQSPEMRDRLLQYLGTRTEHFQHEFFHFARSPFDLVGYDRNAIYSNRTYATEVVSSESEEEIPIIEPADVSIEILNETPSVESIPPIQLNTTTIPNLSALAGMAGIIQRNLHHQLGDWNKKDDLKRAKDKHVRGREEREKRKNEEGRRRKNKKPSRFIRTREDMERNFPHLLEDRVNPASSGSMGSGSRESPLEVPAFASHSNSPIDLSVSRDIDDPGPSTSRGISGGLTRLVIPDSDSDGEIQPLVIHDPESRNKSVEGEDLRKSVDLSKKDGGSEGRQGNSSLDKLSEKGEKSKHSGSKKDSDDESEIEPSGNVLNNKEDTVIKDTNSTVDQWIEQSMQLQASDQAYLDPSTGLVEFIDGKASPVADTWELNEAVSWEEMDELEVVDVVRSNPRKRAEPEVVELIDDSDDDSGHINVDGYIPVTVDDHAGYAHPVGGEVQMQHPRADSGGIVLNDEPINISSDEESVAPENEYSTIQDYIVDHPLPAGLPLRMSLYQPATSRWDDDSSSDYDQFGSRGREKKKGKGKGKSTGRSRPKSSSDDDDLIVVKTEYNTIDPITKKEIVDPVRNKKCNHIYERETILQNIDVAKQNGKAVKCPYMGCNCRDFKKSDLIKDKEVLNHIVKVKQEKEEEAAKKKEEEKKSQEKRKEEREKRKAERKKKRKEEGRESSVESDGSVRSSDSIICEVIDMLKEKAKESALEGQEEECANNEEVVQEPMSATSATKKTVEHKESSSERQQRRSKSKEKKKKKDRRRSSDKDGQTGQEIIAVRKKSYVVRLDPESRKSFLNESTDEEDDEDLSKRRKKASKRKGKEKQRPNILLKKTPAEKNLNQNVASDNTDEEPKNTRRKKTSGRNEVKDGKNVCDDVLPERTKRKRRRPAFLDDSYSTDDEALCLFSEGQKKKKHKKQKTGSKVASPTQEHTPVKKLQKKVKIVGKKVTETWVRVEETEDPDPTPVNHENVGHKNRAQTNEAKKIAKKALEKLKKRKASDENVPQENEAEVSNNGCNGNLQNQEKSKSETESQKTSGDPKLKSKKKIVQAQEINEEISKNHNQEKRSKHRKSSKAKPSKTTKATTKFLNDVDNESQENDDGKNISRRGTKPVSYEEPGSDFDD